MRQLAGLVMVITLTLTALAAPGVVSAQEADPPQDGELVTVLEVIDGDTIRVERDNGDEEQVRYLGIDSPDLIDEEEEGPEPYSRQAKLANAAFVEGADVLLEPDTSDRDERDRLLRYVWVDTPDGWVMVNERMVALGLAIVGTGEPAVRRTGFLRRSEDQARFAGRGMYDPTVLTRSLVGAEAMGYLFFDAYEARDATMLRRLLRPNVVYVTPDGERFRGRDAVLDRFREEWAVLDPAITIRRSIAQPDVALLDLIIHVHETDDVPLGETSEGADTDAGRRRITASALQRWPNDRLAHYRLYRDE